MCMLVPLRRISAAVRAAVCTRRARSTKVSLLTTFVAAVDSSFFVNGDRYEGMWRDDAMHGLGTMAYRDGSYFEGKFNQGLKHGTGVWYDAVTGTKYTVQYVNNELKDRTPI
eukprot:PhM_4_TR18215/c0_g1_i1/m.16686